MSIPESKLTKNKGQALVETALVLMILVVLVFGIVELGRAMYTKNTLNNAARAGARAAVVTSPLINLPRSYPSYNTTDNIYNNIFGSLFYVDKSSITATVCVADSSGACTANTPAASGDPIKVSITYSGFIYVIPSLFGPTGLIPLTSTFTGSATMRYE
jgi:Flp pilus assembly protein TadG